MHVTVHSPMKVILSKDAVSLDFEALDGQRTILPKHADFVSILTHGIIVVVDTDYTAFYIACTSGVLTKRGRDVSISVRSAVLSDDLPQLKGAIEAEFKKYEEERKETNVAMTRLEAGITRGFMKLSKGEGAA